MKTLNGLKILDFSTLLPGPYASLMLADMGADVLCIKAPGREDLVTTWGIPVDDEGTSSSAAWLGRGKQIKFLDLKTPEGVEKVKHLILNEGYTIILEQFRPGVMAKFGLSYDDLKILCPELIYCSITGYGQTGPMANRAAHDINFLARSGNMACMGRKDTGPVLTNIQIGDMFGGAMHAVTGILAAAYYREQTGHGQFVDISMMDALLPLNAMDGTAYLAGGDLPQPESHLLNGGTVYDFYETADDKWMSVGSLEPKFFAALCCGLGMPEWADGTILKNDSDCVKKKFREIFRTKTQAEWTKIFAPMDACVEPVLTLAEVKKDPQVHARKMLVETQLSDGTTVTQFGCPIKLL